jgi:Fic family protein
MSQRALLLEAHHTTHIEGTQLTIEQAERLWAGKTVDEAEPDDVRELLNYREAFNFVSEYLESGEPITEGLIREIHKRLVEGVRGGQGGPGAYRKIQNYVANSRTREIIYTPPSPEDVPPLMQELVSWLRDESGIHPVLMAGIAQFQRCTFILSSTVTDALRGCCRRWFSTARVMISSGCLRSVNFMTATGALFTWRFRVCASRAWI